MFNSVKIKYFGYGFGAGALFAIISINLVRYL
jgi:hypothetical protein